MVLDASGCPCIQSSRAQSIWFLFFSVMPGSCFNSGVIPDLPWTQGLVFWIIYPNWLLTVDTYSLLNASQQSQGKHKEKTFKRKSMPKSSSKRIAAACSQFSSNARPKQVASRCNKSEIPYLMTRGMCRVSSGPDVPARGLFRKLKFSSLFKVPSQRSDLVCLTNGRTRNANCKETHTVRLEWAHTHMEKKNWNGKKHTERI